MLMSEFSFCYSNVVSRNTICVYPLLSFVCNRVELAFVLVSISVPVVKKHVQKLRDSKINGVTCFLVRFCYWFNSNHIFCTILHSESLVWLVWKLTHKQLLGRASIESMFVRTLRNWNFEFNISQIDRVYCHCVL